MPEPVTEPRPRARLTPYELVFGEESFEAELFPSLRDELEARGAWSTDPDAFALLATVGDALRRLAPAPAPEEERAAPPSRTRELGRLLFHAYHFWRFGRVLLLLGEERARALAAAPPVVGSWSLTAPAPAGYLQLPRHLFWARVAEGMPAEPVDGFFWTLLGAREPDRPPYPRLDVLLALGLRPGRPGLSVLDAGAALPPDGHWADMEARPGGGDFSNVLPGGEASGLHALVTRAEALKLASRAFHAAARPGGLGPEERAEAPATPPGPQALPASALVYRRIGGSGDG